MKTTGSNESVEWGYVRLGWVKQWGNEVKQTYAQ